MKLNKNKIIGLGVTVAVLAGAFWWGGNAPGLQGWGVQTKQDIVLASNTAEKAKDASLADTAPIEAPEEKPTPKPTVEAVTVPAEKPNEKPKDIVAEKPSKKPAKEPIKADAKKESIALRPGGAEGGFTAQEKLDMAKKLAGGSSPGVEKGDKNYSASKGMKIEKSTGKDKYLTDPVPEGKPVPVEPQNTVITDKELTCTMSVRCDTILDNMDWLDPEKVELVPKDGVIFANQTVTFYEGESVFNVLLREMKKNKIHMEFVNTPMYNSAYIEGIHNLYEFDCGELSGWMYKVNGWFPNYGCSRYQLKQDDTVEWVYTCNLGIDVGGYYALGGE